jgi:xylose isomerase
LKEKAARWNADKEIRALRAEINIGDEKLEKLASGFSEEAVKRLKGMKFDRKGLGARGLPYERLDQLTMEILMGVR